MAVKLVTIIASTEFHREYPPLTLLHCNFCNPENVNVLQVPEHGIYRKYIS